MAGQDAPLGDFGKLNPDRVLSLVEDSMGVSCSNLFRTHSSYINRVFEVETTEREPLVVKFYRPGRWSREAILDEHLFLADLSDSEIPVVAPLTMARGETLAEADGLMFAVFPKKSGRSVDEFSDDQWLQLGRLLGRVHQVGAMRTADARITMVPQCSTREQLEYLQNSPVVPEDLKGELERVVSGVITEISPLFADCEIIRIHGDCHFSNLVHRPGESLFLIDFDDMAMGPPIQDVWMLLPGDLTEAFVEFDMFVEGYETFRSFDRRSIQLLEPLRAMRFIHYMSWCARQVAGDGHTRVVDGFGSRDYWLRELDDLVDQQQRIKKAKHLPGNMA